MLKVQRHFIVLDLKRIKSIFRVYIILKNRDRRGIIGRHRGVGRNESMTKRVSGDLTSSKKRGKELSHFLLFVVRKRDVEEDPVPR